MDWNDGQMMKYQYINKNTALIWPFSCKYLDTTGLSCSSTVCLLYYEQVSATYFERTSTLFFYRLLTMCHMCINCRRNGWHQKCFEMNRRMRSKFFMLLPHMCAFPLFYLTNDLFTVYIADVMFSAMGLYYGNFVPCYSHGKV